jgi:hypothetical protein
MLATITVLDRNWKKATAHAAIDGLFAVTPAIGGEGIDAIGVWTVTHIPTGAAILTAFSPVHARIAQRALAKLPLDWRSDKMAKYRRQWRKYRLPVAALRDELRQQGVKVQL